MKLRPAKTIWFGLMCLAAVTCMLPLEPVDKYLVFIYLLSALFLGWLLYLCGVLGRNLQRQNNALTQATEELHRLSVQSSQTQQQLERQAALYRNLLKAVPMALYWKDSEGKLIGYNPEYAQVAGLKRMEEGLFSAQTEMFEARQEGLPLDLEVMSKDIELLFLPQTLVKNGQQRHYLVSKIAIKDDSGKVCGLLGGVLNQDLLKVPQERSICSHLKQACAAETLPMMVVDPAGRVIHINGPMQQRFAVNPSRILSEGLAALFDPDACQAITQRLERIAQTHSTDSQTFFLRQDENYFCVTARPIYDGTSHIRTLLLLVDISDMKRAEAYIEELLYRHRLTLNDVTHRLNHLRRSVADGSFAADVESCIETIANLNTFLTETTHAMEPIHTAIDIRQLTEAIRRSVAERYDEAAPMECRVAEDCPSRVEGDAQKLHQAMMILAEQAVEAGAVPLTLGVETAAASEGHVNVSLFVEQAGLLPLGDQVKAIIDPDVSLLDWYHDCRHHDQAISLRVVARLLTKAGYRLEIDSCSGRTRYTVRIGLVQAASKDELPAVETTTSHHTESNGTVSPSTAEDSLQILAVDDVIENLMLLEAMLKRPGWVVTRCRDGRQAVEKCLCQAFDLILMDIRMPNMDGLEAARKIRNEGMNLTTPILAMTASDDKDDHLSALEAGCSDYLTKPISRKTLEQKVIRYLAKAQQLRQAQQGCDISSFLEGNPDYYKAIEMFVNGLPGRIEELRQAMEHNDPKDLAFKAHALKGVGGFAGFPIYTEKAARMEEAISAGDMDTVQRQIDEMVQLCLRTKIKSDAK